LICYEIKPNKQQEREEAKECEREGVVKEKGKGERGTHTQQTQRDE
jgi:hypothetical protein